MRRNLFPILGCVLIVGFLTPVLATDDGYTVNSGSNDWNSGNWTLGHAPYGGNPGDYGFITNTPAAGTTNIVDLNGGWSVGVGGGFNINNPSSSGLNMFLVNNGGSFSADYLTVGTNGVIEVAAGGYLVDWQQLNIQAGGTVHINGSSLSYAGYSGGGVLAIAGTLVGDSATFDGIYNGTANGLDVQNGGQLIARNFVNQSAQNTSYNTFNTTAGGSGAAGTKFIFDGTNTVSASSYTQQFFTAGLRLTGGFVGTPASATATQQVSSFASVTGFQNNFALDRLELGNAGTNSILELSAAADIGGGADTNALFVNDLWLFGGSELIISNNTALYFVNSNSWTSANVTLLGNAEIHQLVLGASELSAIPEPSVVLLWLSGGATLYFARRRARKSGKRS